MGSLGISGTATAAPSDPQASVADVTLDNTLAILKPYLIANEQGKIALEVPATVITGVDPAAYGVITSSISFVNESHSILQKIEASPATPGTLSTAADDLSDADIPPFPAESDLEMSQPTVGVGGAVKAFIKFVRSAWGEIVKAAKASGKWALHKTIRCADGAVSALWNYYDNDASALAQDIATQYAVPLAVASAGCIRKL